jgi:hypothetical protein
MTADMRVVFQHLWQEVAQLHSTWKVFSQLYTVGEERVALLRRTAPKFFGIIQRVLLDSIILSISRLTDPDRSAGRDNLSLMRLVTHISAEHDADLYDRASQALEDLSNHCAPFRPHRNQRIAHIDLNTALHPNPAPLPAFDGQRIQIALEKIAELMNMIELHFDDATTAYDQVVIEGDGDRLILLLSQAVEYRKLKAKRLRGH